MPSVTPIGQRTVSINFEKCEKIFLVNKMLDAPQMADEGAILHLVLSLGRLLCARLHNFQLIEYFPHN